MQIPIYIMAAISAVGATIQAVNVGYSPASLMQAASSVTTLLLVVWDQLRGAKEMRSDVRAAIKQQVADLTAAEEGGKTEGQRPMVISGTGHTIISAQVVHYHAAVGQPGDVMMDRRESA